MGFLDGLLGRKGLPIGQLLLERRWVSIYETPGAEWEFGEGERETPEFVLREIKYAAQTGGERLFLYAKDYDGPSQGRETVEQLAERYWRAHYNPLLSSFDALHIRRTTQTLMRGAAPACEVVVDGVARRGSATRVRERYTPLPGHLLIVSAMGGPRLFEVHGAQIERWFSSVTFHALPPSQ